MLTSENATPQIGYMLKLHWDSDSEPLEQEVDSLLNHWQWEEEELEIWLESLKEIQTVKAVK
ncbi:MAG: hypothetical protein JNK57_19600 [Planctomycetaceae bacterium]|nr:hypothetical protein [Planctomycetaceae bacterium]